MRCGCAITKHKNAGKGLILTLLASPYRTLGDLRQISEVLERAHELRVYSRHLLVILGLFSETELRT